MYVVSVLLLMLNSVSSQDIIGDTPWFERTLETRRLRRSHLTHSDCGIEFTPLKSLPYVEAFEYEPWNVRVERIINWNRLSRRRFVGTPRIIGFNTISGQFPWTAFITTGRGWFRTSGCTGSLLTTRFVVTAAHCIYPLNVNKIRVFIGVDPPDRNRLIRRPVVNAFIHPCYQDKDLNIYDPNNCPNPLREHDVALIQIDPTEPMKHHPDNWYRFNTVCLTNEPLLDFDNMEVFRVSGWGYTLVDGKYEVAQHLKWNEYASDGLNLDQSGIYLYTFPNSSICQGDSGAPVVLQNTDGRWFQVGVFRGPTRETKPNEECTYAGRAVFTNLMHPIIYYWIVRVVGENTPNANNN